MPRSRSRKRWETSSVPSTCVGAEGSEGGGMPVGGISKGNKGSGKWSRVSEVRMREVRGTKTRWHR
jgi:hypothetical protein